MWRVKNASAHHVVSARFEHEALPDPVEFAKEVLTFFRHVLPNQLRAPGLYESNRITTGVSINAFENVVHTRFKIQDSGFKIGFANSPELSGNFTVSPF